MLFPFSYFFTSQQQLLSDRISAFRTAEYKLLEYAKTRFAHFHHPHLQNEHLPRVEYDKLLKNHHFELFDTPIRVPKVIVRGDAMVCQVHGDSKDSSDSEDYYYSIHGVKVTNKQLLSKSSTTSSSTTRQQSQQAPLVLLHGYANGSLYFYRNLMGLSHYFGRIYALDMLGWGLSSRPKFELMSTAPDGTDADNTSCSGMYCESKVNENGDGSSSTDKEYIKTKQKVSTAESFFVESLESWRKQNNLPKLTLAGHSMGGYLSVAYAEKYPQHVEKLILLSPVGVPEKSPKEDESRLGHLPFHVRCIIKTVRYLFERGFTPGTFLRSLPASKSKALVDGYVTNRLPAITCPDERKHLSDYLYHNSMLPGSGEFCLSEILDSGAMAKIPLIHRIPELVTNGSNEDGMEVHMVYGQNDWMSYLGGIDTQRLCYTKRLQWEEENSQTNNNGNSISNPPPPPRVYVHGVKDASHLLMLDNYQEFNAALILASGQDEKNLPPEMPRPTEFVCNELLNDRNKSLGKRSVVGEEDAAVFFKGARWNRGKGRQDDNEQ